MERKILIIFLVVLATVAVLIGCSGEKNKGNLPPLIDSFLPEKESLEVLVDESIDFSVIASDPDEDPLGYVWEQTGGDFSLTNKDKATWKAAGLPGEGTVKVTISDGKDGIVSHTWQITIKNEDNAPPIIHSFLPEEENLEVLVDESIDFSVIASDPDEDPLGYVWEQTGGGFSLTNKDRATWKAAGLPGEGTVKVTISDGKNGTVSHTWQIIVKDKVNNPPVIDSVIPQETALQAVTSDNIDFSVVVSDPDGDTLEYAWEQNGGGFNGTNKGTASWQALKAGEGFVRVTVSDGKGGNISHEWQITIKKKVNNPPTIVSSLPYNDFVYAGLDEIIEFSVIVEDSDGDDLNYSWEQSKGAFTEINEGAASWQAKDSDEEGFVRVTVSDGKGGTVSREWEITTEYLIEGYNQHDYRKLAAFLEIRNAHGQKNGEKLSGGYNVHDPETWGEFFTWDEYPKQIYKIGFRQQWKGLEGSLDLSNCLTLIEVDCQNNYITEINLNNCKAIFKLDCFMNPVRVLNLDNCTSLYNINCSSNYLCSLDVGTCINLYALDCRENFLTRLDVSNCPHLHVLYCDPSVEVIGWPK